MHVFTSGLLEVRAHDPEMRVTKRCGFIAVLSTLQVTCTAKYAYFAVGAVGHVLMLAIHGHLRFSKKKCRSTFPGVKSAEDHDSGIHFFSKTVLLCALRLFIKNTHIHNRKVSLATP